MLVVGCAVVASAAAGVVRAEPGQAEPPAASAGELRAMLDQYCVTCHNERLQTAGLMLDKMDVDHIPTGAEVWEKVGRKLRFAAMPPPGRPRPDRAVVEGVVATLETALDRAAAAQPNPGRRTLHRLNRTEKIVKRDR
jgi:mono/diheme cytochrome c family protein